MSEKMTLEENTEFSNLILTPIIMMIDQAVETYDIERLKLTYGDMQEQQSIAAALPFPETMDKADSLGSMNNLYGKILELIELRIKQREIAVKQSRNPGADILKQLGLE